MTIRGVVFDVGGVLERIVDTGMSEKWERRLGLAPGGFDTALARHDAGERAAVGALTEADFLEIFARTFGLDGAAADEMMRDMWDAYCGELDVELADYFAGLRPRFRTAILTNSGDGARREEQARYNFADLADVLVYTHEVGVCKPDPRVYRLTEQRLGVAAEEIAFLDDEPSFVDAARACRWHGVLHESTRTSIAALERLLRDAGHPRHAGKAVG